MDATTAEPRVALVMITHNRVGEVLRSLANLVRLPESPRIVLVDNGSSDGTVSAVAERFPQVEVINLGRNLGAAARTVGVRQVDAPYVAFCDDDVWWEPGSLRAAADLFDRLPRLAVLTARVLVGPANREDPACAVLAASPLTREPGMPGPALLGFFAGASVVRGSAFLEAGGFEHGSSSAAKKNSSRPTSRPRAGGSATHRSWSFIIILRPSAMRGGVAARWPATHSGSRGCADRCASPSTRLGGRPGAPRGVAPRGAVWWRPVAVSRGPCETAGFFLPGSNRDFVFSRPAPHVLRTRPRRRSPSRRLPLLHL